MYQKRRAICWLVLTVGAALTAIAAILPQQSPPPPPAIYSGTVRIIGALNSEPPSFGDIVAVMGEYESDSVSVFNGTYDGLILGPPNTSHEGQTVQFFWVEDVRRVPASESEIFHASGTPQLKTLNLSFTRSPRSPVPEESVDRSILGKALVGLIVITIIVRGVYWAITRKKPMEW